MATIADAGFPIDGGERLCQPATGMFFGDNLITNRNWVR